MNITWACLLLVGGLAVLWKSAGLLVSGAVGLAKHFGISPLVIGLTVVAMGTSAPEVAASIAAALRGAGDIAVGNVYGSNIANLALVGGLAALIRPIHIQKRMLRREMPAMLIVALMLWPVLRNQSLSRPEGVGLLSVFAALILLTVYLARKETIKLATKSKERNEEMDSRLRGNDIKKSVLFVAIGLVGLALGAKMTVDGAVYIGEQVGLSDAVIGLTIIAIGTSLPELATCVAAAIKAQHDISIGNLVGSNIFNTLLVTGTAGTIRPFEIVERLAAGSDYWIMIAVSAAFAGLAVLGRRVIGRLAGSILLCIYIAYMIYLFAFSR
jgi:cation:H+ antiporter